MLKVGSNLSLEVQMEEETKNYKCKIADMNESVIFIDYPINEKTNRQAFLPAGTKVIVQFVLDHSTVYSFNSEITGRVKDTIPLLTLHFPGEESFKKIQRRDFVRVKAAIEVLLEFKDNDLQFESITDNFSAGGCAILLPENIKLEANQVGIITLSLTMNSGKTLNPALKCQVIRIFTQQNRSLFSVKFLNVDPDTEQKLIRYSFERELHDRRKGLI